MVDEGFVPANKNFEWLCNRASGWQFGEQGILGELYERLKYWITFGQEVGAGNGYELPLMLEPLLGKIPIQAIESSAENCKRLREKFLDWTEESEDNRHTLRIINEHVDRYFVPTGHMLVIDIDSYDWCVFFNGMLQDDMRNIIVACVEHADLCGEQPSNRPTIAQSLSGKQATWQQLALLAESRMTLLGTTRVNAIFVRTDLIGRLRAR